MRNLLWRRHVASLLIRPCRFESPRFQPQLLRAQRYTSNDATRKTSRGATAGYTNGASSSNTTGSTASSNHTTHNSHGTINGSGSGPSDRDMLLYLLLSPREWDWRYGYAAVICMIAYVTWRENFSSYGRKAREEREKEEARALEEGGFQGRGGANTTANPYAGSGRVVGLAPHAFSAYELVGKTPVSGTSGVFTLVPAGDANGHTPGGWDKSRERREYGLRELNRHGIWSVEIKQPLLQIVREYTPLFLPLGAAPGGEREQQKDEGKYEGRALRFLIREELHGEVSGWIHRLPLGTRMEVRGPRSRCAVGSDVGEVLFLAGGTGIAPALQLAGSFLERTSEGEEEGLPRMRILWANRRREDCEGGVSDTRPNVGWMGRLLWSGGFRKDRSQLEQRGVLVEELERLKAAYGGRLTVDYFVDEEKNFITWEALKPALAESRTTVENREGHSRTKHMVLVSGPEGFVSHFAGPKRWQNGREGQGELGGVLRSADTLGWEVLKL